MAPPRAWSSTPPASRAREARPTLAVATVVLDSPRSIGRWIRHHVRIGALDVLLYANRATIDTVAAAATGHSAVRVFPLEDVVAARGDSAWFLSWRSCARCCEGATRPSSVPWMCERRMFVAPQGHAARRPRYYRASHSTPRTDTTLHTRRTYTRPTHMRACGLR